MNGMAASPQSDATNEAARITAAEREFIAAREAWHRNQNAKVRQAQEQQDQ